MDTKSTSALKLPNVIENLSTVKEHKHSGTRIYQLCNMRGNKLQASSKPQQILAFASFRL